MMATNIDTCIEGYGVVCGAEVNLNPDCSLQITAGTLILPDGTVQHTGLQQYHYYVKPDLLPDAVKKALFAYLKITQLDPKQMQFLLLAPDNADPATVDSLKQQHPDDVPTRNLLANKVVAVLAIADAEGGMGLYWLLVSRDAIAVAMGFTPSGATGGGLFSRPVNKKEIDLLSLDQFLRPVLKLPVLAVPRVGYKELALVQSFKGLIEDNLQFPYTTLNTFSALFFEYKAILDDHIPKFHDALTTMHQYFGPVLSHKDAAYLENYRKVLLLKLKTFYEQGDCLYYIQYFYDWLRDLTAAYRELVELLAGFRGGCPCAGGAGQAGDSGVLVLLGPVFGGRTTYQPLVFRDLAIAAETDRRIRQLRCLHWRLLMMIRTFDLPFLHLEKVLTPIYGSQGIEEQLDSTDYWEAVNAASNKETETENNFLPVKFTPDRGSLAPLGRRSIPYYYPLDSNSMYSLHLFWDYETTVLRQMDTLLSYNAHFGDPSLPSTDVVNDSYTDRVEVVLPLAFDIEPFPHLRPEGHIGKHLTVDSTGKKWYLESFGLLEYLQTYNLDVDVVAVELTEEDTTTTVFPLTHLFGLEHRPVIGQGHTLVLLFTKNDEQIELTECKKDQRPEIAAGTIVADFVLPGCLHCYADVAANFIILRGQLPVHTT